MAFGDRSQTDGGKARRKRKPTPRVPAKPLVLAPKPTGVFAQPKLAPVTVRRDSDKRAARKAARTPVRNVSVAVVPKLARPTQAQRTAAARLAVRSLAGQGIHTKAQLDALPARERRRANRLLGYTATRDKYRQAAYALMQSATADQATDSADKLQAAIDAFRVERVAPPPRVTVRQLASEGRALANIRNPRAKARAPHGLGKGASMLGSAALHLSPADALKATTVVAQAAEKLPESVRKRLNAGTGGFDEHGPLTNLGRDVLHFPYDAVNSGIQVGKAGAELIKGRPTPALKLAQAIGRSAVETVKHPLDHPLYTALTFAGGYGALGRTAGAFARSGGASLRLVGRGEKLRALGDTRRPDLVLEQGPRGLRISRSYSKNLMTAAAQKWVDRGAIRVEVRDSAGRKRTGVMYSGSERRRAHLERRAVAEQSSMAQDVGRTGRESTRRAGDIAVGHRGKPTRARSEIERVAAALNAIPVSRRSVRVYAADKARGAKRSARIAASRSVPTKLKLPGVPLTAIQGPAFRIRPERELAVPIAKTLLGHEKSSLPEVAARLRSEVKRLDDAWESSRSEMSLAGRRANRNRVGAMRALLAQIEKGGPRVEKRVAAALARGEQYRRVAANVSQRLVDEKLLTPEQARSAAFIDYAVSRFADEGVHFNPKRMATEADAAAYEQAIGAKRGAGAAAREAIQAESRARVVLGKAQQRRVDRADRRHAAIVKPGESLGATRGARVTAYIDRVMNAAENGERPAVLRMSREEAKDAARVEAARTALNAAVTNRRLAVVGARDAGRAALKAKPRQFVRGLELGDGRKLTQADIEARFRQEYGPDASIPAHVSAAPAAQGAGAYFVNWLSRSRSRKTADTYRKTGRAEQLGISAADEQGAVDALVHSAGVLEAAKNWDRFIGAFGITAPEGWRGNRDGLMTWDDAEALAESLASGENAALPSHGRLVPVRVAPGRYDEQRILEILQRQAPDAAETPKGLISQRVADALAGKPPTDAERSRTPNTVLVPENVLKEFDKHQAPSSNELVGLGRAFTNTFRTTVLPLSVKWLAGNVAEAILRLAVAGATPLDVALGRRVIRDLIAHDAEAGASFLARTQGGLLYGTAERASARVGTLMDDTALEAPAQAVQAIRHAPAVKQAIDGYMAYAHAAFSFNRWIEQQFQAAVIGKEIRRQVAEDTQSWAKSWAVAVGHGRDAYRDALEGLTDTPAQVRFARAIDETLGKYSRFSPNMRRLTQNIAPFLPWYLNAVRFVYWSLPVHHPIKTAILANAEQIFAKDMQAQADALPPGDLGANPQRSDGGITPLTRYTPFGAFTTFGREGEVLSDNALDPLLPQVQGVYAIAKFGKDVFGRDLQTQDGSKPARAALAAYAFLEAFVPLAQVARRLQEHGETGFADSTFWHPRTKPGSSSGRTSLERVFVPWSPTYLSATTSGGGRRALIDSAVQGGGSAPAAPAAAGGTPGAALTPQQAAEYLARHR